MDLISIIMPAFNSEKYITRTIESVIDQTYKNWELVIIDDGSNDNTKNICDEFSKKDSRIKLYSKNNEGVSVARNYGIKHANGKYIMFLDADDIYTKDMIQSMYEVMQNQNVDVVRANYYKMKNNLKIQNTEQFESKKYLHLEIENEVIPMLLKEKFHCYVWLLMIKKELISEFNNQIHIFEDFNFYIDVLLKANSLYMMKNELYCYNADNENSLTKRNVDSNIESMILAENIIKETLKNYKQDSQENIKILDTRILVDIINYIYMLQYQKNFKIAMKKYNEILENENFKFIMSNYTEKYVTKKEKIFTQQITKKHYILFKLLCMIKNIKNKRKVNK